MVCDGLNCGLICGIRNPQSDLCIEYRKRIAEALKPSRNNRSDEIAFLECIVNDLKVFSTHFKYKRLIAAITGRMAQLRAMR
jgi:hypothetical protein